MSFDIAFFRRPFFEHEPKCLRIEEVAQDEMRIRRCGLETLMIFEPCQTAGSKQRDLAGPASEEVEFNGYSRGLV